MSKFQLPTVLTLLICTACVLCLSNGLWAQTKQSNDEFSNLLQSKSRELSAQEVNEILAIRKRLGGGTGLELDALFLDQNQDLSPNESSLPPRTTLNLSPLKPVANSVPQPASLAKPQNRPLEPQTIVPSNMSNYRKIARKMEELAADLEDLNLFEDADILRERANRLRNIVRTAMKKSNQIR